MGGFWGAREGALRLSAAFLPSSLSKPSKPSLLNPLTLNPPPTLNPSSPPQTPTHPTPPKTPNPPTTQINNKVPGLGLRLDSTKLDLQYHTTYAAKELPDAYERLLLDVVNGARCFCALRLARAPPPWALRCRGFSRPLLGGDCFE